MYTIINLISIIRNSFVDMTTNKKAPTEWRRKRKERSLKIHTVNNDYVM